MFSRFSWFLIHKRLRCFENFSIGKLKHTLKTIRHIRCSPNVCLIRKSIKEYSLHLTMAKRKKREGGEKEGGRKGKGGEGGGERGHKECIKSVGDLPPLPWMASSTQERWERPGWYAPSGWVPCLSYCEPLTWLSVIQVSQAYIFIQLGRNRVILLLVPVWRLL